MTKAKNQNQEAQDAQEAQEQTSPTDGQTEAQAASVDATEALPGAGDVHPDLRMAAEHSGTADTDRVYQNAVRSLDVTSDDASSAEDMEALALKGETAPAGWAYNGQTGGFFEADVEIPANAPMRITRK